MSELHDPWGTIALFVSFSLLWSAFAGLMLALFMSACKVTDPGPNPSAVDVFRVCWNGDPADVSTAWLRAEQSLLLMGQNGQARIAKIHYLRSLPLVQHVERSTTSKGWIQSIQQRTPIHSAYS